MSSVKPKLRIASAFAALATLALAASCTGFFVKPTLTSIAISPSAPQVAINAQTTLEVFGTFDDGSRSQVKSGISWSTSAPTVASIDPVSGVLTGVSLGPPATATITADAQGLTATATATVFVTGVTAITVSPSTGTVSITSGSPALFTASAAANGTSVDITGSASWTVTPASSFVTCSFVSPDEQCSATTGAATGNYTITVSYAGTNVVGTATLTVNP